MQSYLTFIEQVKRYNSYIENIQFLVSGTDVKIRDTVFSNICENAFMQDKNLIIINDAKKTQENIQKIENMGFIIKDGFDNNHESSNILNIKNIKELSRFRNILCIMGYSEREQQKLISYLNLIYHLETLSNKGNIELNMDILSSYSATMLVEAKLQELLEQGNINKEQRQYLLAKYMEVSSIGADFENSIYLLIPFLNKMETNFLTSEKSAYIFSFKDFSFDIVLKELIFKILIKTLEVSDTEKIEIIILDEGTGRNNYLSDVLADLSDICNVHMFTKDLFSMKNTEKVLNQFTAKIYSKHQNMSSCQEIETLLGKVLIARYSYTETQDNRLSKNSAWDILFGRDKLEAYTINAPVWEAKYSKELINSFSPGNGIIEFMGNSSQFVL